MHLPHTHSTKNHRREWAFVVVSVIAAEHESQILPDVKRMLASLDFESAAACHLSSAPALFPRPNPGRRSHLQCL